MDKQKLQRKGANSYPCRSFPYSQGTEQGGEVWKLHLKGTNRVCLNLDLTVSLPDSRPH